MDTTFYADGMNLAPVGTLFADEVNEVYICLDTASPLKQSYYILIAIQNRDTAKNMLQVMSEQIKNDERPYIADFSSGGYLYFVFPYREERRLSRFGQGQILAVHDWENYCLELAICCMVSKLPYPLLKLILDQDNINIDRDFGAFLTYTLALKELNPKDGEAECVGQCVEAMLDAYPASYTMSKSARVMVKKYDRSAYRSFNELYRDIKVTALGNRRRGFFGSVFGAISDSGLFFKRLLITVAVCAVVIALIVLISQMIFGDVPLFRFFQHTFDNIGTRSLES